MLLRETLARLPIGRVIQPGELDAEVLRAREADRLLPAPRATPAHGVHIVYAVRAEFPRGY